MGALLFTTLCVCAFAFTNGFQNAVSSNSIGIRYGDFIQEIMSSKRHYPNATPNLVDLARQLGLNLLVKAVKKAGMEDVLDHEGPFTWFGPTDKAVLNAPKFCYNNPLRDVMQYHVAKGSYSVKTFKNEQLLPALLADRDIRINIYHNGSVVTANGRIIIKTDQHAFNGQLNIIGEMMCSLYVGSALYEMNRCPTLHLFTVGVSMVEASFANLLNGTKPLSIFAPTNEAVQKLPEETIAKLRSNTTILLETLKNHVVMGTLYSAGLDNGLQLTTLHGSTLSVGGQPGNWILNNKAKLVLADATVSNGVVHAIDSVLLPPGV